MDAVELTPEHPVPTVVDWARTAEAEGFDAVFASHHYNNRDEFVTLGQVAAATEEISLGPGVVNPAETHPVSLASRMATLDELADGRGLFGVGPGDRSTLSNLGLDPESPLRLVLETMQVARRLFDGERVDHEGAFEAADAGLNYEVGPIPVYVGAQGPHMTRMSAKYADGVLYNGSHPKDVAWAGDRVEEGLADRPEERGEFDFGVYASVSVADDEAAAREAARPPVAFIAGSAPEPVLDRHGLDHDRAERVGDLISAGEFTEAFGTVSPAMVDAFSVAGTPETVAKRFADLLSTADSIVVGSPLGPDPEAAIPLAREALRLARR